MHVLFPALFFLYAPHFVFLPFFSPLIKLQFCVGQLVCILSDFGYLTSSGKTYFLAFAKFCHLSSPFVEAIQRINHLISLGTVPRNQEGIEKEQDGCHF